MKIDMSRLAKALDSLYPASAIVAHVANASMQLDPDTAVKATVQKVCTTIVKCVQDQLDDQPRVSYDQSVDEAFWKACVVSGLHNSTVEEAISDADVALATLIDRRKPETEGEKE